MLRLAPPCALAAFVLGACSDPPGPVDDPGWMTPLDDARMISELSIPGTHESAALHEPIVGSAKCQELTLETQLAIGVRFFDIRCRHMDDAFRIFHGPVDELQTFDDVVATTTAFLDAHPGETVLMSIKEESTPVNATRSFEATFRSYVDRDPDRWLLADAIPTLAMARGKIVLVRRFAATATPLGLDASAWADDTTFTLATAATLRVQDEYRVAAIDAKWAAITALAEEARVGAPSTLYLDYTSGYVTHDGIPNNLDVADEINPMLDAFLRGRSARLGVFAMDHVDLGRVQGVIRTNDPP